MVRGKNTFPFSQRMVTISTTENYLYSYHHILVKQERTEYIFTD